MDEYIWHIFGAMFVIFGLLLFGVWLLQQRLERTALLEGVPDQPPPPAPTGANGPHSMVNTIRERTANPPMIVVNSADSKGVIVPVQERDRTALFTDMHPEERGHTAIGAKPGDGKTQTSIALMVQDIARGAQVYWLNPQYTLYHPTDQPTDLRPIAHLFTVVDSYDQILATLQAAHALGETRKPLYREGKDVGHNVVLYLDEWPAIVAELGDPVVTVLQRLLRECRKLNIWVVLCAQDFLVATTGFSSGVRSSFETRLVGNVDITTWNTLLGGGVQKVPVAKGTWMTEDGLVDVVRPSPLLIANMARLSPRRYAPLVSTISSDDELIESLVLQEFCASIDAETELKPFQERKINVSPTTEPQNEDVDPFRNVDFRPLARLVKARLVTETDCLKVAFGVKPGGGEAYKSARDGLKKALQELEEK